MAIVATLTPPAATYKLRISVNVIRALEAMDVFVLVITFICVFCLLLMSLVLLLIRIKVVLHVPD